MAMMHNSLVNYYELIFAFKQYHGWSMDEVLDLMPWELEVVTTMLTNYLETKKLAEHQRQASMNSL